MWPINGTDQLVQLEADGRLVAVLVAQQFDQAVLNWLFRSWDELHQLSGMRWHMAIPTREPVPRTPADLDVELSNRLREMYGISRNQTPVLVLDNFIEESNQLYFKLRGNENFLRNLFIEVAEFVENYYMTVPYDGASTRIWRRDLIDQLYDRIRWTQGIDAVVGLVRRAVSPLSLGFLRSGG